MNETWRKGMDELKRREMRYNFVMVKFWWLQKQHAVNRTTGELIITPLNNTFA